MGKKNQVKFKFKFFILFPLEKANILKIKERREATKKEKKI
jgi:hypothetical protein